ncbi:MAG TPA: prolyl oligopeptidase family serine peptidase [Verrucomicrobiae bacterium]|jgi:dienelactone hydrolase
MNTRPIVSLWIAALISAAGAVEAAEATAALASRVPPPGIRISASDRAELEAGLAELAREIDALRVLHHDDGFMLRRLPDVEIFHKAVDWPLRYDEFYRSNEVSIARGLLKQGRERARALREGQTPWLTATGLVVRGYRSEVDGSVQPFGLVIPATFQPGRAADYRLDVWLHGRDNNLTELKFMADRQRSAGEFAPSNAVVLHTYGRYCNAFKFAGETDVLEAIATVSRDYSFDHRRITVRGFSMGGAGTWHLAAHHPELWAAAAPGAGFAETAEYTGALKKEPKPAWFEQKLWHLYDATDYAANLFNFPVLAYSGELDKQKQAADVMARAMKAQGLELMHLIGPGVQHKYEPKTKLELARRFDELTAKGRESLPAKVHFTTWTLRYHQAAWVSVEGLQKHWERAQVEAEILNEHIVKAKTENVSALAFELQHSTFRPEQVLLDGQSITIQPIRTSGAGPIRFERSGRSWQLASRENEKDALRKRPHLQGPIDDAFMDSFIMVRPTGRPLHEKPGAWVMTELAQATNEWRAQFRGEARVKDDTDINGNDIAFSNLILWGDPQSNKLLAKIADKLPLRWDGEKLRLGQKTFSASSHVPVMIFPNPLDPKHYIVLNSGFTFAAAGAGSNAGQTPKLPDFAILDLDAPPAARLTTGVVAAGFFDERWQLPERLE